MIRLRLLDGQEETFEAGLVVAAYEVLDGEGRTVTHANTKAEAERKARRFRVMYPERRFFVDGAR